MQSRGLWGCEEGSRAPPVASGGVWSLPQEIEAELKRAPPLRGVHRALVPLAVFAVLAVSVAAYWGLPTAPLSLWAVSLGLGHFWPRLRAREMADFWTPRERYLRIEIEARGFSVESAGSFRQVCWSTVRRLHRAEGGWLLWLDATPPLWVPRSAFSSADAELVDQVFVGLGVRPPPRGLGWVYAGALGVSLATTFFWLSAL